MWKLFATGKGSLGSLWIRNSSFLLFLEVSLWRWSNNLTEFLSSGALIGSSLMLRLYLPPGLVSNDFDITSVEIVWKFVSKFLRLVLLEKNDFGFLDFHFHWILREFYPLSDIFDICPWELLSNSDCSIRNPGFSLDLTEIISR